MDIDMYLRLLGSVLFPIIVSVAFYLLERKTKFGKMKSGLRQSIIGIFFGMIAIYGTEFGFNFLGATINARDAGPLCAGLLFGPISGIVAGTIGGLERWVAVAWGAGEYSRLACSLSTFLAGVYAAVLRKYMFDDKRTTFSLGFFIAIVMEVIHLSILFLTHLSDSQNAFAIVKKCTVPMLLCNAVAVSVSILVITIISNGIHIEKSRIKNIAQKVQSDMLICVVIAYLCTTAFVYSVQTGTAVNTIKKTMRLNILDVSSLLINDLQEPETIAKNRHIGNDGYLILVDRLTMSAVSSPFRDENIKLCELGIDIAKDIEQNELHQSKTGGQKIYWMYAEYDDYYIFTVAPATSVFESRNSAFYINSYMEVIVFALLFTLIYFLIKRLVVDNIRSVNKNLEQIINGDLSVTVDVRSSKEFASLSDDINTTITTLNRYIDEAAARIDAELKFAKSIQESALPTVGVALQEIAEFDIDALMETAKEVGGDFYDFYMLGENQLVFLVADVSGKGIPAAMFMMRAKTMLKTLAEEGRPVDEIFTIANEKLCEGNEAGMFVTAWMGILDIKTGHITFANAGHNPPLVYNKKEGTYSYLKSKVGFVLAGMEGVKYRLQEFDLSKDDSIFLYTDGVTEATDLNEQLYGEDRLLELLNSIQGESPKDTIETVKRDVDRFVGEAEQFDDITMVMIKYKK